MKRNGKILLSCAVALALSACTMSRPPEYDLPAGGGLVQGQEITVGVNENLYGVAQRNNVRLRDLIVVNQLRPPYRVKAGQKLYLPLKDSYAAPIPAAAPLAPIDKNGVVSTAPQLSGGDVTAVPLAPPPGQGEQAAPVVIEGKAEAVEEDAPKKTNLMTETKPRAATDVPEIDIRNLREELQKEETERAAVQASPSRAAPETQASPVAAPAFPQFAWPVRGTIISPFGPNGKGRDNDGINIAAPKGAPVKAAAAGTVAYAGNEMKGFGNLVLIRHPDGWVTAYAHLNRMVIAKDATVKAGEMIGTVGASGNVRSPQLHFEVRREGKPVDPELMLK